MIFLLLFLFFLSSSVFLLLLFSFVYSFFSYNLFRSASQGARFFSMWWMQGCNKWVEFTGAFLRT